MEGLGCLSVVVKNCLDFPEAAREVLCNAWQGKEKGQTRFERKTDEDEEEAMETTRKP